MVTAVNIRKCLTGLKASIHIAQGILDEAVAQLHKAIAFNPDPILAFYHLGQVYEKTGDTRKAMEVYREALERLLKKSGKN
jgi:Tfp pilus assembly protein PilF